MAVDGDMGDMETKAVIEFKEISIYKSSEIYYLICSDSEVFVLNVISLSFVFSSILQQVTSLMFGQSYLWGAVHPLSPPLE